MGGTILLADDSPHTLRMGREYLTGLGYAVITAVDGPAALAALASLAPPQPELILVDAALPGLAAPLGGVELCRRVKADAAGSATPVLLLLGALTRLEPAQLSLADGVLRKPLSSAGLEAWLRPSSGLQAAGTRPSRALTPDEFLVLAVQDAAEGR